MGVCLYVCLFVSLSLTPPVGLLATIVLFGLAFYPGDVCVYLEKHYLGRDGGGSSSQLDKLIRECVSKQGGGQLLGAFNVDYSSLDNFVNVNDWGLESIPAGISGIDTAPISAALNNIGSSLYSIQPTDSDTYTRATPNVARAGLDSASLQRATEGKGGRWGGPSLGHLETSL